MGDSIFRKKSIERIQAPENLNDYIRVVNPAVWMVLAGTLILLIGACVWGLFGRLESTVSTRANIRDQVAVCNVNREQIGEVLPGMTVRIDGNEGSVLDCDPAACTVTVNAGVPDGIYDALIVLESVHPFSFIFD